jgi:excisionase family DNA binding protein
MTHALPSLLTVADVAQRWAVDQSTVRRLISRGTLTGRRIAGCVRVRVEDVLAYEEAGTISPPRSVPTPRPRPQTARPTTDWRVEFEAIKRSI